jgi:acyl carrier protein
MSDSEIFATVATILSAYLPKGGAQPLSDSSSLPDDLGINSARMIDIVLELEDKFGISIQDSDMERMTTIGDVVRLVSNLVASKSDAVTENPPMTR